MHFICTAIRTPINDTCLICMLSAPMSFMQIAKVLGARVVAVVRGQAKVTALRELGADVVIDSAAHKDEPLRKLIKVGFKLGA